MRRILVGVILAVLAVGTAAVASGWDPPPNSRGRQKMCVDCFDPPPICGPCEKYVPQDCKHCAWCEPIKNCTP